MVFITKLRWAYRLFKSKNFIVLLDEAGVMSIDVVDPHDIDDLIPLLAQKGAVEDLMEGLETLGKQHTDAIRLLKRRLSQNSKAKK